MTPTPSTRSAGSEGAEAPRTMLIDREKVAEALASLPRPGAFDEAIVMEVAQWYADGLLVRAAPPSAPDPEPGRDLSVADMLDTLRWIINKDGAIPEKGSDREQRFIDLWTRRLR